jgi:hypothetical protein
LRLEDSGKHPQASERAVVTRKGAQGKVSSEPRGIRLPAREFGTTKTTRLVIPIGSEPDPSSPQAAEPHQSPATPRLFGMPSLTQPPLVLGPDLESCLAKVAIAILGRSESRICREKAIRANFSRFLFRFLILACSLWLTTNQGSGLACPC